MKAKLSIGVLAILFSWAVLAVETPEEGKTVLNEMKSAKEREILKLEKDILSFQNQINEILPFFIEKKASEIKNNKIIKETRSGYTWEFGSREIFVVNESIDITLNNSKVDSFSINFRKSRMNDRLNPNTFLKAIVGKTDAESTKINLKVQTKEPGILPEEETKDIDLNSVSIEEKLFVYKLYRDNLFSMLKYLELRKEAELNKRNAVVRNSLRF
jgi:hypothetical protein